MIIPHRQSHRDFDHAWRKAFVQRILNFFSGKPSDLFSFEEVRQQLHLNTPHYNGLEDVSLDKIIGSVGRYRDFTRTFLPRHSGLRDRWAAIEERMQEIGLSPVELYKVGDAYFVRDGNHRVSVARAQGAPTIEAYVWEYPSLVALDPDDDLDDLLIKHGYVEFLEQTRLNKLRPDQEIEFTAPGRYRDLREHIEFHRHELSQERGEEVSYEEAVTRWYDNIYQPVIRLIREHGILKHFPNRTESDLYVWIWRWQHELSERYGQSLSLEEAIDNLADQPDLLDEYEGDNEQS